MVHYLVYDLFKAVFVTHLDQVNQAYLWLSFALVLVLSVLLHHAVDTPSQRYFRRLSPR
jgi:peptidoglycan/LPS O-acetylase OafA/YrhL